MGELYRLDFPNGKSYVGITKNFSSSRFEDHKRRAFGGSKKKYLLSNAWKKHGDPKLVILAVLENHMLPEAEVRAVKAFKTMAPDGYNMTPGGEVSPMTVPEVAAKMAASSKGKKLSEEHKAKIGAASRRPQIIAALVARSKGRKMSSEERINLSEKMKAIWSDPSKRIVFKNLHTPDTFAKISETKSAKGRS